MLRVGLTGGIGAGKSAVADRLAELGAVIVDSDRIAREVVAPGTDGLRDVVAAFGERVLDADGALDRAALAGIVFADPAARIQLEGITHPRVRARSAALVAAAPADAVVVNDVPLLVEVGLTPTYHLVLVVTAAPEVRVGRLVRTRGMTSGQARERIAAQADDARRRAAADVLLTNEGELADLRREIDIVWRDRLVPYEENLRHRRPAGTVPRVLDQPDPSWPEQYERLAARIRHAVGSLAMRVDHVGPTAVPEAPAHDVIAIEVTVAVRADLDGIAGPLTEAGFPRCAAGGAGPDSADGPVRRHASADPGRPAEVQVRVAGAVSRPGPADHRTGTGAR
ncbi:dephospho-CoA kinase [Plantactinospora sp. GCM10030261]|uniref:dephospho-CoA kinase n=1 Tax=Plantactinospora sp. GCM10030261 TaxID=3273420 RepID=UPI00360F3952